MSRARASRYPLVVHFGLRHWSAGGFALAVLLLTACGGGDSPSTTPQASPVAIRTPATATRVATTPTVLPTSRPVSTATSAAVPGPDLAISTQVSTTYYDVSGITTEAIFDSIELNGPRLDDGALGLGLTSWVFPATDWTGRPATDGCYLASLTASIEIVVTLPRLVDFASASPMIQERWQSLANAVALHEQRHVDIVEDGFADLEAQLGALGPGSSCAALDSAVTDILRDAESAIGAANDAFHVEDGATTAARRLPLEQQIEANEAELTRLDAEIAAIGASLSGSSASIDALETYLKGLEAELRQIERDYPGNALPPQVYDRYQALVQEYNGNLDQYNRLVDQHNQAAGRGDALTAQYNALVEATNTLVEELTWLQ